MHDVNSTKTDTDLNMPLKTQHPNNLKYFVSPVSFITSYTYTHHHHYPYPCPYLYVYPYPCLAPFHAFVSIRPMQLFFSQILHSRDLDHYPQRRLRPSLGLNLDLPLIPNPQLKPVRVPVATYHLHSDVCGGCKRTYRVDWPCRGERIDEQVELVRMSLWLRDSRRSRVWYCLRADGGQGDGCHCHCSNLIHWYDHLYLCEDRRSGAE